MFFLLTWVAVAMFLWALIDLAALVLIDADPTRGFVCIAECAGCAAALVVRSFVR